MKCKSGEVFKTLCEKSPFSTWETFQNDKIHYTEKVELNLALAQSKMLI